MLTAQQLDRMKSTVVDSLPDELVVFRLQSVYDDGGSYNDTWVEEATYPCRIGLPLGGETDVRRTSKTRVADEDLYTVWMPAKSDVLKTDRIEWSGVTFEVYQVLQRGNWELTRRLRIKEL